MSLWEEIERNLQGHEENMQSWTKSWTLLIEIRSLSLIAVNVTYDTDILQQMYFIIHNMLSRCSFHGISCTRWNQLCVCVGWKLTIVEGEKDQGLTLFSFLHKEQ